MPGALTRQVYACYQRNGLSSRGMPGMMQGTFPMEVLETPDEFDDLSRGFVRSAESTSMKNVKNSKETPNRFARTLRGQLEGNTLVIQAVVRTTPCGSATPHSMNMRITEAHSPRQRRIHGEPGHCRRSSS